MRSAEEAKAYVSKLRTILRYIGSCDGDMEKGNLRADVNVSVRRPGEAARHALRDQERQLDPLHRPGDRGTRRGGRSPSSRTAARSSRRRGCSIRHAGETRSMRSKEEAHDYRYFPDPDLLPLELDDGSHRRAGRRSAGTARRQEGALHARTTASPPTTPRSSSPSGRRRISLRAPSSTAASSAMRRQSPTG